MNFILTVLLFEIKGLSHLRNPYHKFVEKRKSKINFLPTLVSYSINGEIK